MVKRYNIYKSWFAEVRRYIIKYQYVILFLFFSVGYFLWRYIGFDFIVWDDTASASFNLFANNAYYSLDGGNILIRTLKDVFGNIQGDGYRPLCALIKIIGIAYYTNPAMTPVPFILINALINGLLAAVYFRFALHFVRTPLAALLAVILFLFSTPFLSGALITFSGNQGVVPLFICAGLLCYYKIVEQKRPKLLWLTLLIFIMLLGPLYREFIGLLPILIMISEIQRSRYSSSIMFIAFLFFLHALFPTALVKWTLFPNLRILPVFAMGNLGDFLRRGIGEGNFLHALVSTIAHLHWRIFIDIVSIYPPTAFVLFFLVWWLKFRRDGKSAIDSNTTFLIIFFFLSFLPFLKIFNEQVHLLYSLVPMSILLAAAVENIWFMTANLRYFRQGVKNILVLIIVMIVADHTLNVYVVRKVTDDIYKGIMESADWFLQNVPKGTPVITNAHHLEDVRFYSRGHIEPWGAPGGIPDQRRWMHNASDLQKLLDENRGRNVYFFDVQIKETPGQRGLGRTLFYVRDKNVEMEDLGILHTTQSRYPFLDPLKYLIPIGQMTWPGPPDLEFDFYRGPALDGTPFHREVYAMYHIYKATSDKVIDFSEYPPKLVEENYYGFNLVSFRNRIYAIPQPEGAFELERVEKGDYSRSFQSDSVDEVKRAISQAYGQDETEAVKTVEYPPKLVEENYYGFNLVLFRGRIYAIPQPEGAFELERVEKGGYSRSFQGDSVDEVKRAISQAYRQDKAKAAKTIESPPRLVEENYYGFNLVSFRNRIYAIPQPEGAFELERVKKGGYSRSFQGDSIEKVKKAIDKTR
ncbi:MAG: hypothetical protein ABSE89_09905 [Sedimentisphaerales bacterium]